MFDEEVVYKKENEEFNNKNKKKDVRIKGKIINTSSLKVRTRPDKNSEVKTLLRAGVEVEKIANADNGFIKISYNSDGSTGFILSKFWEES